MKKIYIIIIFLSLTSCLGTKKISQQSSDTKTTHKSEIVKDSVSTTTVNKAIHDTVKVTVPVSDPIVDAKIDEILRKLYSSKTSGDNSYRFWYDEKLRELRAEFKVAQTQNKEQLIDKTQTTEKSFEQRTDEYIKKKITALPWWIYIVAIFLLRKQIVSILSVFFPQIKAITWVSRLVG